MAKEYVMKNLFSNRLSLFICILMSASAAKAGSQEELYKFSPCPNKPNCVSSQSTNTARYLAPLQYAGSLPDARQKLIEVLKNTKRVILVKAETDYIHAEFRSRIFGFVDDVEFYFPPEERIIHVKSASRTGYYDFGANRRRVELIRNELEKLAE
jgi:uncharacterized protein (DUF1499 family)